MQDRNELFFEILVDIYHYKHVDLRSKQQEGKPLTFKCLIFLHLFKRLFFFCTNNNISFISRN